MTLINLAVNIVRLYSLQICTLFHILTLRFYFLGPDSLSQMINYLFIYYELFKKKKCPSPLLTISLFSIIYGRVSILFYLFIILVFLGSTYK